MIVDILKENRYLIAEHVELDHPLSKGDAVIMKRGEGEIADFLTSHFPRDYVIRSLVEQTNSLGSHKEKVMKILVSI